MSQGTEDKKALGRIALQQRTVVSRGAAEEEPVDLEGLKALSEQHGVPGIDLTQVCIRLQDLDLLPREIAKRHGILPVLVRDDRVFVAMVSPGDKHVIDELEFVTGKRVYPYVALPSALSKAQEAAYEQRNRGEEFYIGPRCPEETLRRMGVLAQSEGEMPFDATPAPASEPQEPPRVVGDVTDRAASDSELSEADFPNTSVDLSVVTDLPDSAPMAGRSAAESDVRTILIVDDEVDIRKMLARLLTDRGYQVLEADRGLQALRLVKEKVPDIIILDAMLPEVHGFEIARRIKGSQRYGHIPIIMISAVYRGWRYAEDVKASYGVNAYIEKPFRIAEILKAIDEVAKTSSSDKPAIAERKKVSEAAEQALAAGVAAYQAGNLDAAIEHLKQGVNIDPLAYRLHFHLGLLCGKKGLVYEAIQHLERALDINARHFPAMKNLAVLYQKAGFRNKAIETCERAIAIAPDEATKQSIKELLLGLL
ncbi:MAG TPA: response regulator [Polyangiaceae bacterium]|nr:response regulator [Polyangiaceae bacterium]